MEFKNDRALGVLMGTYLKKIIVELPEVIMGRVPTPAADHMFKTTQGGEGTGPLVFHHKVAHLLFMATRARGTKRNPNC